ncbi:MAG TPA: hypothetical protein GXX29_12785 [Firmicutes bacterium]|nr:hypothetical protein [Bacillota bacterium]
MITGDSQAAASAVTGELYLTRYRAKCLPGDKAAVIRELRTQGRVMTIGGRH